MTQNRDREVNFQKNSREFSRIETLAGHWCVCAGRLGGELGGRQGHQGDEKGGLGAG